MYVRLVVLSRSQVFVCKTQADNVSELMPALLGNSFIQVVLLEGAEAFWKINMNPWQTNELEIRGLV